MEKSPTHVLNERARELREEPDMPEKSLRWYRKLILEAQAQLCNVLMKAKRNDQKETEAE